MSIVGSLPNLQVLKLKNNACGGDTWETSDGEFPQLKFLLIEASNLEHWWNLWLAKWVNLLAGPLVCMGSRKYVWVIELFPDERLAGC
ncbi:hypothetical protein ACS0TY_004852 [Phlomoides rotata]